MTIEDLDNIVTSATAEMNVLRRDVSILESQISEKRSEHASYRRATEVLTKLVDLELSGFHSALSDVANCIIAQTFGDQYSVFFDLVGTQGFSVKASVGDLVDTVDESQGEGFKSIVSLALLLAATSISPTLTNGFICFDEPFPGVRGEERLRGLYQWLSDVSKLLDVQLIVVAIHNEAVEAADNVISLGDRDAA